MMHVFKADGHFIRSFRSAVRPVTDFAALTNDGIIVVRDVSGRETIDSLPIVSLIDTTGSLIQAFVTLGNTAELRNRPFVLPLTNPVRVSSAPNGTFAVWFPYDPTVLVFRNGRQVAKVQSCLAPELLAFYEKQRSSGLRSSAGLRQVLGVGVDNNGHIQMAMSNHLHERPAGRLVDFSPNGEALKTLDFEFPKLEMAYSNVLIVSPGTFLSWGIQFSGALTRWTIS